MCRNATRFSGSYAVSVKTARNIVFASGSSLRTVHGNLSLEANQQEPAASFTGAGITVPDAVVEATGTGAVTVKGRGGSAGSAGVLVEQSGQIKGGTDPSDAGLLIVEGRGGLFSGQNNYGVFVSTPSALPTVSAIGSNGAGVKVTGTGGGTATSANNHGVYLANGRITAGGQGRVTVEGYGGNTRNSPSGSFNYGVWIASATSSITSNDGAVRVVGIGGGGDPAGTAGTGGANRGVLINAGGSITSASSTASVTVEGRGGNSTGAGNFGVYLALGAVPNDQSRITSGGGDVTVTGIEGSGTDTRRGILVTNPGLISTATNGGALMVITDSFQGTSSQSITARSSGTATITSRSPGVAIDLGLVTETPGGPLAISPFELASLAGGTLAFGTTTSGTITLSAALTVPTGSDVTLSTATSAGVIPSASGIDLTLTGKTLRFGSGTPLKPSISGTTVDTGYQQLRVAGAVDLTGATLALTGSYVPQPGDVFTLVSAASRTGTFTGLAQGDVVVFNGTSLQVGYTDTAVTLTAFSAPVVTAPPTNGTATAGQTASFSASATGTPSPTVQWQQSTDGGTSWSDIPGATAGTYAFTASGSDSGRQYRAVFANSVGTTPSAAATLTVTKLSTTTALSSSANPSLSGAPVTFTATVTAGATGSVSFYDGVTLLGTRTLDTGSATLSTAALAAGTHSITATYSGDADHDSSTSPALSQAVQTPAVVTLQPIGGTYLPGATTTLTAAASGNPAPTVQWQTDTGSGWTNLAGATSQSLAVVVSAGMPPQPYRAVFTNAAGTAISDAATVQAATAVPSQISAVRSGLILNRSNGLFEGTITLRNTGTNALASFAMLLSGLTTGVTLANASGTLSDGTSYLNTGPLAAGQTISVRLSFRKAQASSAVSYTANFYLNP